jgi:hypothetical protein
VMYEGAHISFDCIIYLGGKRDWASDVPW